MVISFICNQNKLVWILCFVFVYCISDKRNRCVTSAQIQCTVSAPCLNVLFHSDNNEIPLSIQTIAYLMKQNCFRHFFYRTVAIMEGPEVTFLFQFGNMRDMVTVPASTINLKTLKDLACDFINSKVRIANIYLIDVWIKCVMSCAVQSSKEESECTEPTTRLLNTFCFSWTFVI